MAKNIFDSFFTMGERATGGDPVRKAQYDYYLYWIVFLAFLSIAISYYYSFFFGSAKISTLLWAIVITVFCWFNYWGLVTFRGIYHNMKSAMEGIERSKKNKGFKDVEKKEESIDEMLGGFKDGNT